MLPLGVLKKCAFFSIPSYTPDLLAHPRRPAQSFQPTAPAPLIAGRPAEGAPGGGALCANGGCGAKGGGGAESVYCVPANGGGGYCGRLRVRLRRQHAWQRNCGVVGAVAGYAFLARSR